MIDQLSNGNLITGVSNGNSIITDLAGNQLNNFQPIYGGSVNCLKELPDGSIAFAGGTSQAIYIWKTPSNQVQINVNTSDNILITTPCKAMIIYNSSILAVSSNSNLTYLVDITSLQLIKKLSLTTSIANCLETNCKHIHFRIFFEIFCLNL